MELFNGQIMQELGLKKIDGKINIKNRDDPKYRTYITSTFGPQFLSYQYKKWFEKQIDNPVILPKEIYNAPYCTYSENIITKHMLTGVWGKDHLVLKDEHAKYYKLKRKLDPINFDFYKNYL